MKKLFTVIAFMPFLASAQAPCIANTHSLNFSSAYVQLPLNAAIDLTDSITVEAWINPLSFGVNAAENSIFCKHGWSQGERGYVLRCGSTGILSFNIAGLDTNGVNTSWKTVLSPSNALVVNTWQHVAGTYDGDTLRLFVNGVQVATTGFKGTIDQSYSYPARIGRLADPAQSATRYFNGKIDEVRIWNRALTVAELLNNYNHHVTVANVTGLAGYWRFNEGAGAYTYDSSGNAITGTLMSALFNTQVPFNEIPPQPTISYNAGIFTSSALTGNQWFFTGNPIPGATQQTYQPMQPGQYTVMVTAPGGCTSMSNPVTVNNQGLNENAANDFVKMSRNGNLLELTLTNGNNDFNFTLIDQAGKIVMQQSINGLSTTIDLNPLNSGMYHLLISSGDKIYREKILR